MDSKDTVVNKISKVLYTQAINILIPSKRVGGNSHLSVRILKVRNIQTCRIFPEKLLHSYISQIHLLLRSCSYSWTRMPGFKSCLPNVRKNIQSLCSSVSSSEKWGNCQCLHQDIDLRISRINIYTVYKIVPGIWEALCKSERVLLLLLEKCYQWYLFSSLNMSLNFVICEKSVVNQLSIDFELVNFDQMLMD